MFARENRISKQKDFEEIFRNGKTIKGGFFKILFLVNNKGFNRYSIIVSKKVNKSAVSRNLIKRKIRKEFKNRIFKKPVDLVFIVYPNIINKNNNYSNDIQKALGKI